MKKQLLTGLLLLLSVLSALAQDRSVTGTVKDPDGAPLPGVSVLVKGSTRGSITDGTGAYRINVGDNSTLIFSAVGQKTQEIAVGAKAVIDVVLSSTETSLDEVVVVGYGTQSKRTVTGSVAAVEGRDLVKSPQPNVSNSLVGRTPGLIANNRSGEPGSDGSLLLIRGRSTTGNADPLIVVDGVANRAGGFDRLNPNDIESISILKDASASIYGAQAANGVILVTTKRGKSGKPTISYSFNQGFQMPTRVPQMADAATYATLLNEMRYYQNPTNPQYAYTDAEIQKFRDGSDPLNYPNTDWTHSLLKKVALQNQHNLSISGGSDNVKYFVSAQKVFQDGLYKDGATNFKQYQVRSNIDAQVTKNLSVSFDLAARLEDRQRSIEDAGTIFRFALRAAPYLPDFYPNGLPGPAIEQGRNPRVIATDIPGLRRDKKNVFNGTLRARYDLSPLLNGLSVDGFMAYDRIFQPIRSTAKRWTIYSYNKTTNTYDPNYGGPAASTLDQALYEESSLTYNFRVNYDRTFGDHTLNAFLAYEQNEFNSSRFGAFRRNFISAEPTIIDQGGRAATDQEVRGTAFASARQNYFGRLKYNYSNRYLAEFQFRYDGSQNFAPGKRFGFFPSVSVGWVLSEENFIKNNLTFFDNLKLRASYGVLGNDKMFVPGTDIPVQYQFLTTYQFDQGYTLGTPVGLVSGIAASGVPNPNATWEKLKSSNIALDGSLFKNALTFTVDLFSQRRSNILAKRNASVPSYTGVNLPYENIGEVSNKGIEITLAHTNRVGDVRYTVGGNFTYVRNKVLFVDEVPGLEAYQRAEGYPIGSYALWKSLGVFQNQQEIDGYPHVSGTVPGDIKLADVNADGKIDEKDRIRIDQTPVPQIVYGINASAQWKAFDLTVLFQGQGRAKTYVLLESGSTGNFFANEVEKRWRPDRPSNDFPRVADKMYTSLSGNAYPNTFWLRNVSFLRLKNVELGYNVPSAVIQKLRLGSLRVYANGFNLLTFDKYKNIDPEGDSQTGVFYPQQKTFNLGVNVGF